MTTDPSRHMTDTTRLVRVFGDVEHVLQDALITHGLWQIAIGRIDSDPGSPSPLFEGKQQTDDWLKGLRVAFWSRLDSHASEQDAIAAWVNAHRDLFISWWPEAQRTAIQCAPIPHPVASLNTSEDRAEHMSWLRRWKEALQHACDGVIRPMLKDALGAIITEIDVRMEALKCIDLIQRNGGGNDGVNSTAIVYAFYHACATNRQLASMQEAMIVYPAMNDPDRRQKASPYRTSADREPDLLFDALVTAYIAFAAQHVSSGRDDQHHATWVQDNRLPISDWLNGRRTRLRGSQGTFSWRDDVRTCAEDCLRDEIMVLAEALDAIGIAPIASNTPPVWQTGVTLEQAREVLNRLSNHSVSSRSFYLARALEAEIDVREEERRIRQTLRSQGAYTDAVARDRAYQEEAYFHTIRKALGLERHRDRAAARQRSGRSL
jgi:hypothetical protein